MITDIVQQTEGVNRILQLIGYTLIALVAAATIVAYFRVNLAKTQITELRGQIEDLRGDRDDEKARAERFERDLIEEQVLRKSLQEKIKILEEALSGRVQLEHLESILIAHDKRVDERHETLINHMSGILQSLTEVSEGNQAVIESYQGLSGALVDHLQKDSR